MKLFILRFLLCYFFVFAQAIAIAQTTAAILPQGKTQFLNNNGDPLSSGKVFFYIPSTTTFKTTWQDAAKSIANTNPVILDAGGRAIIYGDGTYRQILKDRNNNTIYDAITASAGTGGGTTGTGDGDLVGTIKPWAGLAAPNQYAFAYGQEVSRTVYSVLYTAITLQQSITCTSGSAVASSFSDTTQIPISSIIESVCFAPGTTVLSKTTTTVTFSANSSISTTDNTARIFLYGNGNGSTTFNLPDLRGYVIAGRPNMGGIASSNLTSTYFGANPLATGAKGGLQSSTLITGNLPAYTPLGAVVAAGTISQITPAGTVSTPTITVSGGSLVIASGGATYNLALSGSSGQNSNVTATSSTPTFTGTPVTPTFTNGASTFTGTAQGGTSTAFANVQPTQTLNYIIKITPDSNSADASGVTSLGGMIGDIACGSGLLCTGNIISAIPSSSTAAATTIYGNPTTVTATPSFFSLTGLTNQAAPNATNDFLLLYNAASTSFQKVTVGAVAAAATAGVASLGGMTGALLCGGDLRCSGSTLSHAGPTVNVVTIGAVGNSNGTTGNGTDNTTVFQTAFDTTGSIVSGSEYRKINVPCGTFRITNGITGNNADTTYHIKGQGPCSQIYLDAGVAKTTFSFTSPATSCGGNNQRVPCIIVEDLFFTTPTTPTGSIAINIVNNVATHINNNIISGYGTGIKYSGAYGGQIFANNIVFSRGPAIDLYGVDASANVFRIWSNNIQVNGITNSDGAIKLGTNSGANCASSATAISIQGNDISYNYIGTVMSGVCGVDINANYYEGNTAAPIYFNNGGTNGSITVRNNWMFSSPTPLTSDISFVTGITWENNIIYNHAFTYGTGLTGFTAGYNSLVGSGALPLFCSLSDNCAILPGGKLMQWGTIAATVAGATVTYPKTCPNAVPSLALITDNETGVPSNIRLDTIGLTTMKAYASVGPVTSSWQVICR